MLMACLFVAVICIGSGAGDVLGRLLNKREVSVKYSCLYFFYKNKHPNCPPEKQKPRWC